MAILILIGEKSSFCSSLLLLWRICKSDSPLSNDYCLPPPEIRDIVDAPPLPTLSFSPHRDKILFPKRRSLPPLAELARPEEKLAGIRIGLKCKDLLFSICDISKSAGLLSYKDLQSPSLERVMKRQTTDLKIN